ncbi:uncharacterized protein LOC143289444 [Babylonia areolata]|uniref:uncharacterized protein LOC143289444 n=1 Tax=Babylonia areolata TaxID=304850 RepID=UPI003FD47CD3
MSGKFKVSCVSILRTTCVCISKRWWNFDVIIMQKLLPVSFVAHTVHSLCMRSGKNANLTRHSRISIDDRGPVHSFGMYVPMWTFNLHRILVHGTAKAEADVESLCTEETQQNGMDPHSCDPGHRGSGHTSVMWTPMDPPHRKLST